MTAQVVLATTLGLLFALGTFLVLRRDVVRVVWGVSIISQAANVYLITMGGLVGGAPVGSFAEGPTPTDPLVQALVLTAIVIGFGTTALALVLTYRVYEEHGTIDTHALAENPGTDAGVATDGGAVAVETGDAAGASAAGDDAAGTTDADATHGGDER